mmetsp:Transcript_13678/g.16100  ORF Transcript_13678/g.16100 Transcript_13678/m.16100 type:complete len:296 (+) Transcript_13678:173-1060(+)
MSTNILLRLLLTAEWEKAVKCVLADNSQAKEWIVTQTRTNVLPIHLACANSIVQVNIIEALALAHPDSLLLCESESLRNPLHIAIRARVSDEVVAFLMEKCPTAVTAQDSLGRIPLHYAGSNQVSTATINKLTHICPKSVCASDNLGWTPLHVASSLYETPDGVEAMLDACPEAVFMITNKGRSSYDVAQENRSSAKERICEILIEVEEDFQSMTEVRNIRAAEMHIAEQKRDKSMIRIGRDFRNTKTRGVRNRVRSAFRNIRVKNTQIAEKKGNRPMIRMGRYFRKTMAKSMSK